MPSLMSLSLIVPLVGEMASDCIRRGSAFPGLACGFLYHAVSPYADTTNTASISTSAFRGSADTPMAARAG
jgi:hypothetical protein